MATKRGNSVPHFGYSLWPVCRHDRPLIGGNLSPLPPTMRGVGTAAFAGSWLLTSCKSGQPAKAIQRPEKSTPHQKIAETKAIDCRRFTNQRKHNAFKPAAQRNPNFQ